MIAETIARLTAQMSALKLVEGAQGFQAASEANPKAEPGAFVLRLKEQAGQSETYAPIQQRVAVEIGVVYVVRNAADPKGEAAGADMETLRAAGRAALLGWAAPGCDPYQFGGGALLAFRDGRAWWQDVYRTYYDIAS